MELEIRNVAKINRVDKTAIDKIKQKAEKSSITFSKKETKSKKPGTVKIKSSLDRKKTAELSVSTVDWGEWDVQDIAQKMVDFGEKAFYPKMRPYQLVPLKRMFEAFLKNEGSILTILISRQAGKSVLLSKFNNVVMTLGPHFSKALSRPA